MTYADRISNFAQMVNSVKIKKQVNSNKFFITKNILSLMSWTTIETFFNLMNVCVYICLITIYKSRTSLFKCRHIPEPEIVKIVYFLFSFWSSIWTLWFFRFIFSEVFVLYIQYAFPMYRYPWRKKWDATVRSVCSPLKILNFRKLWLNFSIAWRGVQNQPKYGCVSRFILIKTTYT